MALVLGSITVNADGTYTTVDGMAAYMFLDYVPFLTLPDPASPPSPPLYNGDAATWASRAQQQRKTVLQALADMCTGFATGIITEINLHGSGGGVSSITTTANFNIPASIGSTVIGVTFATTASFLVGNVIFNTFGGYFTVAAITSSTTANLTWTGGGTGSAGNLVGSGSTFDIAGQPGQAGSPGATGAQGPAWVTQYSVDLAVQAASTASANGSFSVAGKTWTVANFANSSFVGLDGSTGLKITCNAVNSDWTTPSTDSIPKIYVPISTLITNLDPSASLRIWLYFTSNGNSNFEQALFTFGTPTGHGYNIYATKGWRTSPTNAAYMQFGCELNSVNLADDDHTANVTDDVVVIEVDKLLSNIARVYSGASVGGAFPAITACRFRSQFALGTNANKFSSLTSGLSLPSDFNLMFGVKSTNTAAHASGTLKKLLLETKF